MNGDRSEAGLSIGRLLAGSWRLRVEPANIEPRDLETLVPHLVRSGTAGLAWERLHGSALAAHPAIGTLHDVRRRSALARLQMEHRLALAFKGLRTEGHDPLLIKGWSLMPLYPRVGQRPVGDMDLCVPPGQFDAVRRWFAEHPDLATIVDLHSGVPDLHDRSSPLLWQRSRQLPLGEGSVRVLSREDELRLLCVHFARHGGCRPLWLCDVAVAAEAAGAGFDWKQCLSGDPVATAWARFVLSLSATLLGASVPQEIWSGSDEREAAHWMGERILRSWVSAPRHPERPMQTYLRRPRGALQALAQRYPPNAVEAAFKTSGSPATKLPPAWFQLRYAWMRATRAWWRKMGSETRSAVRIHLDDDR